MRHYPNPFESRASEHHRDIHKFVTTFGISAIDMLPSELWDRLVVIRSSPGAGKTSLMRIFVTQTLLWIRDRSGPKEPIRRALTERDVVTDSGAPRKLGVLLSLDRDYKSLVDLPLANVVRDRLFLRLLDTRILTGVIRAVLETSGLMFPKDIGRCDLDAIEAEASTQAILGEIGGENGLNIVTYARETEVEILNLLNAVLGADLDGRLQGHSELYSLALLEECPIRIDGTAVRLQPLLMFDDGHELAPGQRDILLANLRRRRPSTARWYSERFEAMSEQELLQGLGSQGRDYVQVDLDAAARDGTGHRFTANQHNRLLTDIALRRTTPLLTTYAQESQPFFELLEEPSSAKLPDDFGEKVKLLRLQVLEQATSDTRYEDWVEGADALHGLESAIRWRELAILIARDKRRHPELFATALSGTDLVDRSSPSIREGAELATAISFSLPYYAGKNRLLALGSYNIEQFLSLCGRLFEDLLIDITLGRRPYLSAQRQDRLMRQASEIYWASIAQNVPNGRDVRAIVAEIVRIATMENNKPTMPYPPGVTGTALLMSEREQLLDPKYRNRNPGASRLFSALASAIAYNVLSADMDYSVKGNRYMVLYVNRLLCPRFGLPLGRGAFRERRLSQMLGWVTGLPESGYREPDEAELGLAC